MYHPTLALLITSSLLIINIASCAQQQQHNEVDDRPLPPVIKNAVTGQVLLPDGEGHRGIHLWITTEAADPSSPSNQNSNWVNIDTDGRFQHPLQPGSHPTDITISAVHDDVYQLDAQAMPAADANGHTDVGTIDLRDRLVRHRFTPLAAEGSPSGDIRIAFWQGPPPTGPRGGSVSLGSKQFPTATLGSEIEWLLPPDATDIYILIERHAKAARGQYWQSGYQQQFGPYTAATLPNQLFVAGE